MKTTNDDRQFPEFTRFLSTVQDDELDRLGEVYGTAIATVADLQQRTDAAHQELVRIDEQLVTSPTDQSKLLSKRAEWMQALEIFPAALVEAQRRRGLAHLYWLARLRDVALQEAARAEQAIAPHRATVISMRKRLDRDDASGAGYRQIGESERATMAEQRAATIADMSHDREQQQRAHDVAAVAQARAQMTYGDGIRLEQPALWTAAIEQRARSTPASTGRLGRQHSSVA